MGDLIGSGFEPHTSHTRVESEYDIRKTFGVGVEFVGVGVKNYRLRSSLATTCAMRVGV